MKTLLLFISLQLFLFQLISIKTQNPCPLFEEYKGSACENIKLSDNSK